MSSGNEMIITYDRKKALAREDIEFLSCDHPMVNGAIDMVLGREDGNCSFAIWHSQDSEAILLEVIFVIESIAPANLHIDRFLAATPIRVVVDHSLFR